MDKEMGYMELITIKQQKKMAKIFKLTGKSFQVLAEQAGIEYIPDHLVDLTREEARQFLKYHGRFLTEREYKK